MYSERSYNAASHLFQQRHNPWYNCPTLSLSFVSFSLSETSFTLLSNEGVFSEQTRPFRVKLGVYACSTCRALHKPCMFDWLAARYTNQPCHPCHPSSTNRDSAFMELDSDSTNRANTQRRIWERKLDCNLLLLCLEMILSKMEVVD